MSVSRWPVHFSTLVVAILLSCKADKAPEAPPASAPDEPPSKVEVAAPKAPVLPPRPTLPSSPGGKSTAETIFAAQERDDDWAPGAETEIKRRFIKVRGGTLENAECRQSQCKLVIAGSESEVSRTIADLEGTRGLHGYAKNLLLTAPEKKSDGSVVLRAFAMFDR